MAWKGKAGRGAAGRGVARLGKAREVIHPETEMVFRNGDLIPVDDAAELIDSAQDAAKKLARCCAEKDAEIARLREENEWFHKRAGTARMSVIARERNVWIKKELSRLREAICEVYAMSDGMLQPQGDGRFVTVTVEWKAWKKMCEIAREGR